MYCILLKHLPFVYLFKKQQQQKKNLEKLYNEMTIPIKKDSGDVVLDLALCH